LKIGQKRVQIGQIMVENRSEKGSNWSNNGAKSVQKRFKIGQNLIEKDGQKRVQSWSVYG